MTTAYCGTCRIDLPVPANPPYSVIHVIVKDQEPMHLHAETREPLGDDAETGWSGMEPGSFVFAPKIPGYNTDLINVDAGMKMLARCGYDDPKTEMVIQHALNLWRRGEEAQAQKNAIDLSFHGIDLTSWTMVISAAMAGANAD